MKILKQKVTPKVQITISIELILVIDMKITEIEIIRKPGKKTEYSAKVTEWPPENCIGKNLEGYLDNQGNEAFMSNMSTNMGISQLPMAYGYSMYPYGYPYPWYEFSPPMMKMNDTYSQNEVGLRLYNLVLQICETV